MESKQISIIISVLKGSELNETDHRLLDAAKEATKRSYAPYSKFHVGASLLLSDGTVVTGSNQENAAYPSGLCAERVAVFHANSQYPLLKVEALCIAACEDDGMFTENPVPPCGACRQALLETENRYRQNIRVILYGRKAIYCVSSVRDLLPLQFDDSIL